MPELEQSPEDRALVAQVLEAKELAEPYHRSLRTKWAHFYSLYRSYRELKAAHESTSPRDRDDVLTDAAATFGGGLFIPYCYWTVETIVPRLLSNHPKMLVLPREPAADENVAAMRRLIDAQQEQIEYGLRLQDPAKNGLLYGLGVTKTMWRRESRKKQVLAPRLILPGYTSKEVDVLTFDDPDVENVDPFDFFFDPFGSEVKSLDYAIHRTWRNNRYVKRMVERGVWDKISERDLEAVYSSGPTNKRDEVWAERMAAAGHRDFNARANTLHEVWEFHDGEKVVTVIDGTYVVKECPNPYWHGELPFQVFRPTKVPNELVGIGEIEPIEHLQIEMNTLRQQRRDNATLVLQQAFAYAEGYIDTNKVRFGPAALIPVQGDPRELLMPIRVGDIPNSGYQEEANLAADIERVTGISDQIIGRESRSDQTATEAQLITSAANVRIQNKTWRVEQELARPACQQFIALNQQHITNRELAVQAEPEAGNEADQRWAWEQLSAEQLSGEMVVIPVGGASSPDNLPQDRADARDLWTSFAQDPMVDPQKLRRRVLELMGIKQAETWIAPPPAPPIPPEALDYLVEQGVDPAMIEAALEATQAASVDAAQLPPEEQPAPVVGNGMGGFTMGTGDEPADAASVEVNPEQEAADIELTRAKVVKELAQAAAALERKNENGGEKKPAAASSKK